MGRMVDIDDLVDFGMAGERLGYRQRTVRRWATEWDDFPDPVIRCGTRRLYVFDDIAAWVEATRDRRKKGGGENALRLRPEVLMERQAKARRLLAEGRTFDEIADELQVNRTTGWATGWKQKPRA